MLPLSQILEGRDPRKYFITAALLYSNTAMGILDLFLSPTLVEFSHRLNSSVEAVNTTYALSHIFLMMTAFVFGFVFTKVSRQSLVPLILLVVAVSVLSLPHTGDLPSFAVVLSLVLIGKGAYTAAEMVWLRDLWGEKAGPFIQAENFCRSLGHLITPLVFAPYLRSKNPLLVPSPSDEMELATSTILYGETTDSYSNGEETTTLNYSEFTTTTFPPGEMMGEEENWLPELYTPFEILSGLVGLAAIFQFLIYVYLDLTPLKLSKEETAKMNEEVTPFSFKDFKREWPLILLITLVYTGISVWDYYTLDLLPTFAYFSNIHLSERSSSELLGLTNSVYSIGAFAGIFLNMRYDPRKILSWNILFVFIGNLLLLGGVSHSRSDMVWFSCILIGLGLSTAFPSAAAYAQLSMKFNSVVGALVFVSSLSLMGVGKIVLGTLIESSPNSLVHANLVLVPVAFVSLWGFNAIVKNSKKSIGS